MSELGVLPKTCDPFHLWIYSCCEGPIPFQLRLPRYLIAEVFLPLLAYAYGSAKIFKAHEAAREGKYSS